MAITLFFINIQLKLIWVITLVRYSLDKVVVSNFYHTNCTTSTAELYSFLDRKSHREYFGV